MSAETPLNTRKTHNMNYGAAAGNGSDPSPTHRNLVDEWLLSFDSQHTVAAYRRDSEAFLAWCTDFGHDPLALTPLLADGYRQHVARRFPKKTSRARHLATCSSFYKFVRARHPDLGIDNPFVGTRRPKVSRKSVTAGLSLDQVAVLLDYADECGPREALIVHVLLSTGMRVSELVNANTWDVRRESGYYTIGIARKGGTDDRLPLPREAVEAIRAYTGHRTGAILLNRGCGRVSRQQVSVELDRMARRCGLPRLTPHVLRHTAATIAIDNGATVEQVQRMLGHVDIGTTMRYYHAANDVKDSAVHGLAETYRQAREERRSA